MTFKFANISLMFGLFSAVATFVAMLLLPAISWIPSAPLLGAGIFSVIVTSSVWNALKSVEVHIYEGQTSLSRAVQMLSVVLTVLHLLFFIPAALFLINQELSAILAMVLGIVACVCCLNLHHLLMLPIHDKMLATEYNKKRGIHFDADESLPSSRNVSDEMQDDYTEKPLKRPQRRD